MRDRSILYATAFLRALATGMFAVVLALYLAARQFDPVWIGAIVSAGLAGAAVASLAVTLNGDRLGRRHLLIALAALAGVGGVLIVSVDTPFAIAAAAFLGMLNGMGRDRGAAAVVEQAILPATASADERTRAFAWYTVSQDVGHALGALLGGLPAWLQGLTAVGALPAYQIALAVPALLALAALPLYRRLSPAVEVPAQERGQPLSPASRRILWRIGGLFGLDSVGGGFLTSALLAYFFFERFGVGAGTIGVLFFTARVLNALSHLAAARLAQRIGLLNTIVLTHMPSSLLLATLPWAPTFPIAVGLFLLREGLVEMDVPTRQSYVMAVVRPEERLTAAGITSLVRLAGWAVAPALAGLLMQTQSLAAPLLVGAGLKLVYDGLLYFSFRAVRPPEEGGGT